MLELTVTRADSRGLVARSLELCHGLRPVLAESTALIAQSAELCTIFRRIAGGSDLDSPFIVEIMAVSSVCLE